MSLYVDDTTAAAALAASTAATTTAANEPGEGAVDEEFLQLLREFDATQESPEARRARLKLEDEEAQEHKKKMQRLQELAGRIAQLRAQVAAGAGPEVQAKLDALQTEQFWLMLAPGT